MTQSLDQLKQRILDISKKFKLSHIGSCLGTIETLQKIYSEIAADEFFCLGNSHAALGLYVILEDVYGLDAEELYEKYGTHASRNISDKIYVTGGSLGLVEPIALGLALSNPNKNVYLTSSDGGAMEGSFWETLRYKADHNIDNLKWYVICNGWGAYSPINIAHLEKRIGIFDNQVKIIKINSDFNEFKGLDCHYTTL
jgi:transketolase N-terminal domain/subunit